jgi:hypothetical protein
MEAITANFKEREPELGYVGQGWLNLGLPLY